MATVELERIEKVYPGGTRALFPLSLRIDDGELVVVVGPSGCGKSTVLRLLAGLEQPTAGTLRLAGREVNDETPQQRNVAMVFQDYALYPHMTVRGNLEFPLKMRKTPRSAMARRVAWAAELLEITDVLDRRPAELSGGQRQRVAMGRALVREPAVFLLDEPLSNLDARLRAQVRLEIADLQKRTGTTMLYVTHDQVEAMTLGQRVAVLEGGRLQQVATPRDLYDHPASTFVAGFIGSPPMNLFPTSLARDGAGSVSIALGEHRIAVPPTRLPAREPAASGAATAGIRPESIVVRLAAEAGTIAARVRSIERLGHESLLTVRVPADGAGARGAELVARVKHMPAVAPGDIVYVEVDPGGLHLFAADGRAISP